VVTLEKEHHLIGQTRKTIHMEEPPVMKRVRKSSRGEVIEGEWGKKETSFVEGFVNKLTSGETSSK